MGFRLKLLLEIVKALSRGECFIAHKNRSSARCFYRDRSGSFLTVLPACLSLYGGKCAAQWCTLRNMRGSYAGSFWGAVIGYGRLSEYNAIFKSWR